MNSNFIGMLILYSMEFKARKQRGRKTSPAWLNTMQEWLMRMQMLLFYVYLSASWNQHLSLSCSSTLLWLKILLTLGMTH